MINWSIKLIENKYSRWYNNLIKTAKLRTTVVGYTEHHHIIPRSFGGDNSKENLVQLTAREHYIAHLLLWKMKFDEVHHSKMTYALRLMMFGAGNNLQLRDYKYNARMYEKIRSEFSIDHSRNMKGSNNPFYNKKHSKETIKKIADTKAKTGKHGNKFKPGHQLSADARQKISAAATGRTWDKLFNSEELAIRKMKRSEETRIRNTGVVFSDERRRKISEKAKGRISPLKGIKTGRKRTAEAEAKRLETMKQRVKICEWCKMEVKANVYTRYHGNKCKQST
jgi:hypothetical protein